MSFWIVLPFRGFSTGKSRLAPVLDQTARIALNRQLFLRTAKLVSGTIDAAHILVATPDLEVQSVATGLGLTTLLEPAGLGLNGALELGRKAACDGGAQFVLSLSCDLPFLTSDDILALKTAAQTPDSLVIASDPSGTGTNALVVPSASPFRYAMGEGSADRHRAAATEAGLNVKEIRRPGLEFDLDLPADLARWRSLSEAAA